MRSNTDVRIGRHGIPGYEKTSLITAGGSRRDLSIVVTELDAALFSTSWWTALAGLDPMLLPPVPEDVRVASGLERPIALALSRRHADGIELTMLGTHGLGGANDAVVADPAVARCVAGLAAIAGPTAPDGTPAIAGYAAYLLVCAMHDDAWTPSLPSARIFLGPVVIPPTVDLPPALRLTVCVPAGMQHHDVPLESSVALTALTALEAGHRLPGAAVLLAPHVEHWTEFAGEPGATIRIDAGVLGLHTHPVAVS